MRATITEGAFGPQRRAFRPRPRSASMSAGTSGGGRMRAGASQRVAVVGGGPGGAQCARRLAEGGVEVTLFEPRSGFEKACGGGIPARGIERFPFLSDAEL